MQFLIEHGERSVRSLPGVGPAVAEKLGRLGIGTVEQLLWHLPRTWLDLTRPQPISLIRQDEFAVIRASVLNPRLERTGRRQIKILRADLTDDAGEKISAVWFNQPFLATQLIEGSEWLFWGTPKYDFSQRQLQLASPKFAKQGSVLPIYPETDGLTSAQLRRLIAPLLEQLTDVEYLPVDILTDESLVSRPKALAQLHAPRTIGDVNHGKTRLSLDELIKLFVILGDRRAKRQQGTAAAIPTPVTAIQALTKALPFQLTDAQRKASWEILKDLELPQPMARLLLGDVGSGKTIVALIAAYATLKAGKRVVWLAPTQLLAEQHLKTLQRFLPTDVPAPALVTATQKPASIAAEQLLIGTHALLNQGDQLRPIGLVIIDEQHRFGVKQRQALLEEISGQRPHLLTMTATPIPRSLALTVFGDLDCSFLDQAPSNRKSILTRVIQPTERDKAYDLVAKELVAGRQAYIVCPNIDPVTNAAQLDFDQDSRAVTKRFEVLSNDPRFSAFKVALLHGKLKAADKQMTMAAFVRNEVQLLVATSLIEVGIDVPNATVLVVEGADRFGLAQLHQLRGRVGRGEKQSLCVAIADDWSPIAKERLAAFERSTNGFELAELDLTLRGPGDLLGDLQAGLPPLKLANLADTLMLKRARSITQQLIDRAQTDPILRATIRSILEEGDGSSAGTS